jgi:hypothetical protein
VEILMPRKDPDARRAYQLGWVASHREHVNAKARQARAANLEEARRKDKERTASDRSLFRARNRSSYAVRDQRLKMLSGARARARRKGLEYDLTVEDVVIPTHCPILGIPLVPGSGALGAHHPGSPSIDRLDSSKGYVRGNIEVISHRANVIKNSGTAEEHEAVARFIRSRTKTT